MSCSLEPAEKRDRLADFAALALRAEERIEEQDTISLRFFPDPDLAREAAELASRETDCCSFIKFRLEIQAESLLMVASAPPMFSQVLKRMFSTSPSSTT